MFNHMIWNLLGSFFFVVLNTNQTIIMQLAFYHTSKNVEKILCKRLASFFCMKQNIVLSSIFSFTDIYSEGLIDSYPAAGFRLFDANPLYKPMMASFTGTCMCSPYLNGGCQYTLELDGAVDSQIV